MESNLNQRSTTVVDGVECPVYGGTHGPDVIDIRTLGKQAGKFTYDPGFTSTASCESQITFIDGDEGILLYRGYPIDQLAEESDFIETAYLLLHGDLPSPDALAQFRHDITYHTMVHEHFKNFIHGFRRDAHPMAVMCGAVGALSAFYHDSTDVANPEHRRIAVHRMIAKMPTIAAMAYKYMVGQPFVFPQNKLHYTENFMHMCFAVPAEDYEINKIAASALDKIFILHMDHEQKRVHLDGSPCGLIPAPTLLRVLLLALPAFGGLLMAAPTKQLSGC